MVKSAIFSAIEMRYLPNWKNEMAKIDNFGYLAEHRKYKAQLEELLEKNAKKILTSCIIELENYYDEMYNTLLYRIIHLGIKMGMDLQESLREEIYGLLAF